MELQFGGGVADTRTVSRAVNRTLGSNSRHALMQGIFHTTDPTIRVAFQSALRVRAMRPDASLLFASLLFVDLLFADLLFVDGHVSKSC